MGISIIQSSAALPPDVRKVSDFPERGVIIFRAAPPDFRVTDPIEEETTKPESHRLSAHQAAEPRRRAANHSCLSATSGSTFVARQAGTKQAASATITSNNAMPPNVAGSVALTP
jgi:hypothetical protein